VRACVRVCVCVCVNILYISTCFIHRTIERNTEVKYIPSALRQRGQHSTHANIRICTNFCIV